MLFRSHVRLVSDDGSGITFVGQGHGADRDDKAGGKASTYAWKDALIKGLNLPDADMPDTDNDSGDNSPTTRRISTKSASGKSYSYAEIAGLDDLKAKAKSDMGAAPDDKSAILAAYETRKKEIS